MMKFNRIKIAAASVVMLMLASCGGAKADGTQTESAQTDGVAVSTIGDITLIAINDNEGEKRMPNKLFYGDGDSAKVERLSPEGSVPSSVSCFVVKTQGKTVLFDTGNGTARGGVLLERLSGVGLSPDSIDYLILTHFHGDHIGGMMNGGKPVFTRAEVYAPADEYAYWQTADNPNGRLAMETMKAYSDRLHLFKYGDALPLGIKAMAAPGHTPGHTVYQTGRLFIAGDLMHGFDLQIQDLSICPSYDINPKQAAETRRKYVEYVRKNKLITAGMHFPGSGVKDSL